MFLDGLDPHYDPSLSRRLGLGLHAGPDFRDWAMDSRCTLIERWGESGHYLPPDLNLAVSLARSRGLMSYRVLRFDTALKVFSFITEPAQARACDVIIHNAWRAASSAVIAGTPPGVFPPELCGPYDTGLRAHERDREFVRHREARLRREREERLVRETTWTAASTSSARIDLSLSAGGTHGISTALMRYGRALERTLSARTP
jgi:hypothetical protein